MFNKLRESMLKLSPASRVKVAAQALDLLKRERESGLSAAQPPSLPTKPDTSSASNMLTNSELAQQKQGRANHMAQLRQHYPNVKVV